MVCVVRMIGGVVVFRWHAKELQPYASLILLGMCVYGERKKITLVKVGSTFGNCKSNDAHYIDVGYLIFSVNIVCS
jgi:hypothetical protein